MLKFDFFTCVLVLYDVFMVPFKNSFGAHAFEKSTDAFLDSVDLSIKFVFAIDVILGFRKSYLH